MKYFFWIIGIVFGIGWLAGTGAGCANRIPPTGGPRDTLPPVLVSVVPADSTLNFKADKIVFTFDEFIQLDNISRNLLVSPTMPTNPIVTYRLRTVTVNLHDTLLNPNTTYTLDFGKALKDNNEGNVYENFTYIFSTGNHFDSLSISGKVINAETGTPDSTLLVLLFTQPEDSAVIKERPAYKARLNREGKFMFKNLPSGTFYLYAVKDESGLGRYSGKTQLFAFADDPVVLSPGSSVSDITLYAFVEASETEERTTSRGRQKSEKDPLQYSLNIKDSKLGLNTPLILTFADSLAEVNEGNIRITDTAFRQLMPDSLVLDSTGKIFSIHYPFQSGEEYRLILEEGFARDTIGRTNTSDTLRILTRTESEYGSLRMRFLNLNQDKNPILLLLQNNQVKYTYIFKNREVNLPLVEPGEYDLRIVYDENRNGQWDTGRFFEGRRQPEKVLPIHRKLTIRANWLNEVDIELER